MDTRLRGNKKGASKCYDQHTWIWHNNCIWTQKQWLKLYQNYFWYKIQLIKRYMFATILARTILCVQNSWSFIVIVFWKAFDHFMTVLRPSSNKNALQTTKNVHEMLMERRYKRSVRVKLKDSFAFHIGLCINLSIQVGPSRLF